MEERIKKELELLRTRYPDLRYEKEGRWVLIPAYPLPEGWSKTETDVAFQIPVGYPGTPPYGIYVPVGLTFKGQNLGNYQDPAPTQPPFENSWGILSWNPEPNQWKPIAHITGSSNLLNWVIGFRERFHQGI